MYRGWLGFGLLVVLLVLGIWSSRLMNGIHTPVSQQLETAAQQVLSGDMDTGHATALKAKAAWDMHWRFSAAFSDHAPMDEIDGLFAQMESYAHAESARDFAACCSRIAMLVEAMAEAHWLTWWNLL
jgi:hypothetical protein